MVTESVSKTLNFTHPQTVAVSAPLGPALNAQGPGLVPVAKSPFVRYPLPTTARPFSYNARRTRPAR
ncbi:conserved protein of unknown function [Pseudomonas putida KT2440]|uniref:Uncharacterized protein n=1 Tax=Pseudomonas putida (strain ATCC 47054 / DSM 6125 / CFBP 8728 / NCIMB 11950 / KT2440) TaxID=160488 RepID=Q88LW5_PSEPK|nr:conserved protein of unknown function [Pseudomonas putida KT2440]